MFLRVVMISYIDFNIKSNFEMWFKVEYIVQNVVQTVKMKK
jgi:hypothetical protein